MASCDAASECVRELFVVGSNTEAGRRWHSSSEGVFAWPIFVAIFVPGILYSAFVFHAKYSALRLTRLVSRKLGGTLLQFPAGNQI